MAVKTKSTKISLEQYDAIENEMFEKGYLAHDYIIPAKTLETDVICPVCNEKLFVSRYGDSHRIYCETDSCVDVTFRGL